jgi:hypothetical protein
MGSKNYQFALILAMDESPAAGYGGHFTGNAMLRGELPALILPSWSEKMKSPLSCKNSIYPRTSLKPPSP